MYYRVCGCRIQVGTAETVDLCSTVSGPQMDDPKPRVMEDGFTCVSAGGCAGHGGLGLTVGKPIPHLPVWLTWASLLHGSWVPRASSASTQENKLDLGVMKGLHLWFLANDELCSVAVSMRQIKFEPLLLLILVFPGPRYFLCSVDTATYVLPYF